LAQLKVGGLVIGSADPFFASRIEQLAARRSNMQYQRFTSFANSPRLAA
jgi:hypothetical protein